MERLYERDDRKVDYHITHAKPVYTTAEHTVDKNKRYREIAEILSHKPRLTAKQIAVEMWTRGYTPTPERNFAAPRLTEMYYDGKVMIVGSTTCEYTGKRVKVYAMVEDKESEENGNQQENV